MNFTTPTPEELHALAKLANNPDWKTVQAWLGKVLHEQDVKNRDLKDHLLPQGQGASQVVAYILDTATQARGTLARAQERADKKAALARF